MEPLRPPLTRCPRGHATPSGKTFCEMCGATIDPALTKDLSADLVPEGRRWKGFSRRRAG